VPTPSQAKRKMNDNSKDAVIASLKRKFKRLEEENKELREQLKDNHAEIYNHLQFYKSHGIIKLCINKVVD